MNKYDYLDLGTIWKSKRKGTLVSVIGLANFDLPEKYYKTNPPQVVFTDGTYIFSSTVDRFLSLRTFVRLDEATKASLLETFSAPITEEEEDPSLYLEDEDDDLLLTSDDEDDVEPVIQQSYAHASAESLNASIEASSKSTDASIIKANSKSLCTLKIETIDEDEHMNACAAKLIKYDQFRDIHGVYYHKLTFSSKEAVTYILANTDSIVSMTLMLDKISIPIKANYITSAYPSATNIFSSTNQLLSTEYEYNLITADTALEDLDPEETDTNTESTQSAIEQPLTPSELEASAQDQTEIESEPESKDTLLQKPTAEFASESKVEESVEQREEPESEPESEVEQVSINASYDDNTDSEEQMIALDEDEDDYTNVEEVEQLQDEEELTNAEELPDEALLSSSLIMPEDDIEDLISTADPVSESLASKLESISTEENKTTEQPEEQSKEDLDLTDLDVEQTSTEETVLKLNLNSESDSAAENTDAANIEEVKTESKKEE